MPVKTEAIQQKITQIKQEIEAYRKDPSNGFPVTLLDELVEITIHEIPPQTVNVTVPPENYDSLVRFAEALANNADTDDWVRDAAQEALGG